ncbi:sugar O-acetyltransferase [Celerinatantimonas diazotrophica]|uniref:Acetyltransferase n=1 Tax=Celerinatantimonas diazotrophica TaxID=412034 RepID=A0A4R1K3C7_9GAMM|nr:sugar O-acetyltransferase [Celerinatantimonas diazotrophica]TCK58585.1 maltose O-acetyltransferase [Celerinatantimonas diazotrophica]CAG9297214.1 Maltose O-acetyltransferase [Celerinatantimonas diazotrophica]
MNEFDKMISGDFYYPYDDTLNKMRADARALFEKYNQTSHEQSQIREELIKNLFGAIGKNFFIEPTFQCDYGKNIFIGDHFFANFGCVILDCGRVSIGDHCFIGPQVGIYTACHPLAPAKRDRVIEFTKAVTIGNSCWIGGHATINPGVTLGNNVVVGSGAVVTKSFGDNVVIAGNPASVIRTITADK